MEKKKMFVYFWGVMMACTTLLINSTSVEAAKSLESMVGKYEIVKGGDSYEDDLGKGCQVSNADVGTIIKVELAYDEKDGLGYIGKYVKGTVIKANPNSKYKVGEDIFCVGEENQRWHNMEASNDFNASFALTRPAGNDKSERLFTTTHFIVNEKNINIYDYEDRINTSSDYAVQKVRVNIATLEKIE